jgi:hypothetical protein
LFGEGIVIDDVFHFGDVVGGPHEAGMAGMEGGEHVLILGSGDELVDGGEENEGGEQE